MPGLNVNELFHYQTLVVHENLIHLLIERGTKNMTLL